MKHSPLTAASLIALREAQQRGEERAGPIIVHDLALASEPERSVMLTRIGPANRGRPDGRQHAIFYRTNRIATAGRGRETRAV